MHRIHWRRGSLALTTIATILAVLIGSGAGPSEAAESAQGGLPGDWLAGYSGARSTGLGGAYVASSSDPMGSVWNPAGITGLLQNEAHFESMRLFEDTSMNGFGIAVPNRTLPSIGFTVLALRSGDFERTNELNESLGSFQESDTAFLLTLAKQMGRNLSLGTNFKMVHQSLEEFSGSGFGLDFGAQYRVHPRVRLGASVLNVGGPTVSLREVDEEYPLEIRSGLSLQLLGGRAQLAAEIDKRAGIDATLHSGTEFWLSRSLALRLGYDGSAPTGGFTYRTATGLDLSYGMADHDLGVNHRFGVSFRFGGFFANSVASPEVFSPTGRNSVTKFKLEARTKSDARSWWLEIVNASDEIVRRFGGKGVPPAHITWDGKDENGLPLPDGSYRFHLFVTDVEGREITSREQTVEVLTSGPQGSVPVSIDQ